MKQSLDVIIYDSTLRDGTQGGGVSFSLDDKLRVAEKMNGLGISYIEGGFPGSNPKDIEFFKAVPGLRLDTSIVTAFGSTRKADIKASDDRNLRLLLDSGMPTLTIFGKTWGLHVRDVIRTRLDENLGMIEDSVRFLKDHGHEVIYDAEHFFDGYKDSPEYALKTLAAAGNGGADCLVLCDTNGGSLVQEVQAAVRAVLEQVEVPLGIHTHNDGGLAVANALAAVEMGVSHAQGTFNGYGERSGNASICSLVGNLELKMNKRCLPQGKLQQLTAVSRFISDAANLPHDSRLPFVGEYAFSHKGGMHVDGVQKNPLSFEHIPPEAVGNRRATLLSDVSGRGTLLERIRQYVPDVDKSAPEVLQLLELVKKLEHEGYHFENAEGSFELHIMHSFHLDDELFQRSGFRIIVEKNSDSTPISEATTKIAMGDKVFHTVGEGDGPVDALNQALRKALSETYPAVSRIRLVDYKVHILEDSYGTNAKVRVIIESSDGHHRWGTVGVSENIIEASWEALVDGIRYGLLYPKRRKNGN